MQKSSETIAMVGATVLVKGSRGGNNRRRARKAKNLEIIIPAYFMRIKSLRIGDPICLFDQLSD